MNDDRTIARVRLNSVAGSDWLPIGVGAEDVYMKWGARQAREAMSGEQIVLALGLPEPPAPIVSRTTVVHEHRRKLPTTAERAADVGPTTRRKARERAAPTMGKTRDRIMAALIANPGGLTRSEIAALLGIPKDSANGRVAELRKAGLVRVGSSRGGEGVVMAVTPL